MSLPSIVIASKLHRHELEADALTCDHLQITRIARTSLGAQLVCICRLPAGDCEETAIQRQLVSPITEPFYWGR